MFFDLFRDWRLERAGRAESRMGKAFEKPSAKLIHVKFVDLLLKSSESSTGMTMKTGAFPTMKSGIPI